MTLEKIKKILAEHLDMEADEITKETTFQDLGVDSLDTVELLMKIEEEFGIEIELEDNDNSVGNLCEYIDSKKE